MGFPTFTVWSSEVVATRASGPPKPQCKSVMGRVWRDQTCCGAGVLEGSSCSRLWEEWVQGEGGLHADVPSCLHVATRAIPPKEDSKMVPHGPLYEEDKPIVFVLLIQAHLTHTPQPQPLPALGPWLGLLQRGPPALSASPGSLLLGTSCKGWGATCTGSTPAPGSPCPPRGSGCCLL